MKKIAITTSSFAELDPVPRELIKKGGFKIVINRFGRKLLEEETISLCKGCIGILAGTESYSKNVLCKLRGLRAISRCGVGMENIDLDAAKKLGIKVMNTPSAPTIAVAELTVALMLNLLRKISAMDRGVRGGKWNKQMGNLLFRKRIGIIGFGRIGQKVSELLRFFNCEISYTDVVIKKGVSSDVKHVEIGELLRDSDIISIHVSSNDKIIGERELKQMKNGALLINVARGKVIDEDALCRALKDGHIGGAALDVFSVEPYTGQLSKLENMILTPHIGSYALESRVGMEMEAVKNLLKSLKGAI